VEEESGRSGKKIMIEGVKEYGFDFYATKEGRLEVYFGRYKAKSYPQTPFPEILERDLVHYRENARPRVD
jgi:hypothetical protein